MMVGNRDWLFQEEARKPRAVGETLGRFWNYFRRYAHVLIAVAVLIVVSTFLQVSVPNLMGQAVDCYLVPAPASCWYTVANPQATAAENIAGLGGLVLLIAGMFAVGSLLTGLQFYLMTDAGQRVLRALRIDIFAHLPRPSLVYYSKHEAGDVSARITNDADTIQQAIGFPLIGGIQGRL